MNTQTPLTITDSQHFPNIEHTRRHIFTPTPSTTTTSREQQALKKRGGGKQPNIRPTHLLNLHNTPLKGREIKDQTTRSTQKKNQLNFNSQKPFSWIQTHTKHLLLFKKLIDPIQNKQEKRKKRKVSYLLMLMIITALMRLKLIHTTISLLAQFAEERSSRRAGGFCLTKQQQYD